MLSQLHQLTFGLHDLYVNPFLAVLISVALGGMSWLYAIKHLGKGWFTVDISTISMGTIGYGLSLLILSQLLMGFNQLFIIIGYILFQVITPHYIVNGGMGLTNASSGSLKRLHKNYKLWCYTSLILMAIGTGIHWVQFKDGSWTIGMLMIGLLGMLTTTDPRQLIISQQMLYSFKAIRTFDIEKQNEGD